MEIILSILAALAIVALLNLISDGKKQNTPQIVEEMAEISDLSNFPTEDDDRVHDILKSVYLDLKRQRAGAYGPWLSTFLDGDELYISGYGYRGRPIVDVVRRDVDPSVALTAIRWTIRDILSAPILYDKDGREIPRRVFNLEKLHKAETELMEMMGEGE